MIIFHQMAKLAHGSGVNLPYPFLGDTELRADFLQRDAGVERIADMIMPLIGRVHPPGDARSHDLDRHPFRRRRGHGRPRGAPVMNRPSASRIGALIAAQRRAQRLRLRIAATTGAIVAVAFQRFDVRIVGQATSEEQPARYALQAVREDEDGARALGVRAIFAERQDGALTLRRGRLSRRLSPSSR